VALLYEYFDMESEFVFSGTTEYNRCKTFIYRQWHLEDFCIPALSYMIKHLSSHWISFSNGVSGTLFARQNQI